MKSRKEKLVNNKKRKSKSVAVSKQKDMLQVEHEEEPYALSEGENIEL